MVTPRFHLPVYAASRILFNQMLRLRSFEGDATIGVDADGYAIAGRTSIPHIACIKGVISDAVPFETGAARASMALQARLEATNVRRASLVITISDYCARKIKELYGVPDAVVVPELIDLNLWRELFLANASVPDPGRFTILTVCRFYPRKRLHVLLQAAALLRSRIAGLEMRIVGGGPECARLQALCRELELNATVRFLGDLSLAHLASEYNRSHAFCLPSVQEGFGIVFLEAMAAGRPIVAARSAAVPEVVKHGVLVEPNNPEALAEGILKLYRDPDLRSSLAAAGLDAVQQFSADRIARRFLSAAAAVVPGLRAFRS